MVYQLVLAALAGALSALAFSVTLIVCAESLRPHSIIRKRRPQLSKRTMRQSLVVGDTKNSVPVKAHRLRRVQWLDPIEESEMESLECHNSGRLSVESYGKCHTARIYKSEYARCVKFVGRR